MNDDEKAHLRGSFKLFLSSHKLIVDLTGWWYEVVHTCTCDLLVSFFGVHI